VWERPIAPRTFGKKPGTALQDGLRAVFGGMGNNQRPGEFGDNK